jgi:hypothetical protein
MGVVVETSRGSGYYVPLWESEASTLRQGDLVTVRQLNDSWIKPLDEQLELLAAAQSGAVRLENVRDVALRRLAELGEAGVAERTADGGWKLPNDFRERLVAHTEDPSRVDAPLAKLADALLEHANDPKLGVDLRALEHAVGKRLGELEELGLVSKLSDSEFRLPPALLDALKRLDLERPPAHVALRRPKLSLAQQVSYLGPTWLDDVSPQGGSVFAKELDAFRTRRQAFLDGRGLTRKELVPIERDRVAARESKRMGLGTGRANGFRGVVVALHEEPSGNRYAVIANDRELIAVRSGQKVKRMIGREVEVVFAISEYDGKRKLAMEPALHRRKHERSQDRGR